MSFTNEAKQEVERLLRAGQKIHAVKYIHDTFNVSLADAKKLVEAVELEMNSSGTTYGEGATDTAPEVINPTGSSLTPQAEMHVQALLRSRKKIEAIKYVKEQLTIGLKEAAEIVGEIDEGVIPDDVPASQGPGCAKGVFRIAKLIVGLVTFTLLGIAGLIYYLNEKIAEQGERVEGVVESLKDSGGGAAPVIVYEWRGKEYRYESTLYSNPPDYMQDERVPVFVNRDDPNEILIDRFTDRWLAIAVIAGLGAFFGIFYIVLVFIGRRF